MESTVNTSSQFDPKASIPLRYLFMASVAISIFPFVLNLLQVDFGSHSISFPYDKVGEMTKSELNDAHFYKLTGAFTHTILEWSVFCAASITALLSFIMYRINRDITVPIIGIALFMSGCMDTFHALAADRLIEARADNANLIPFTWAVCRAFKALILMVGVLLVSWKGLTKEKGFNFVVVISLVFGIAAYLIIHYCTTSATLPQTIYPNALVTRPWDGVALVLFVISACIVYPIFHRQNRTLFSAALWISVIPDIAMELHMTFGSTALFDNHFNIAHFLKIISYLVLCTGLLLDYIQTFIEESRTKESYQQVNTELEKFAYIASHDLKAPLRAIDNLSIWIEEDLQEAMTEDSTKNMSLLRGRVKRMKNLVENLLEYSRAGKKDANVETVDINSLIKEVIEFLSPPEGFRIDVQPNLPTITTAKSPLERIFINLIGNGIKHHERPAEGVIKVSCSALGDFYKFDITDNGPGIPTEFHEKVFQMFQTLKPRDEVEGSGMGLTFVDKIVRGYGGSIQLESQAGRGASFRFAWPKKIY